MTVRGALRTMSAEDLLDWIERRGIAATLTVEWSSLVRSFVCDSGILKAASSNEPSEHMGQLLIRAGLLDEDALGRTLESQAESGLPFSRVLIAGGAVRARDIRDVLEGQAREAICDAMAWTEGSFVVEPATDDEPIEFPLALPLRPCIEEGQRRAQRWEEIYQRIPSEDAVLEIVARDRIATARDTADARRELESIAEAIERGLSVGQIVLERYHQRFHALHRLTQLIERGAVDVPGSGAATGDERAVASESGSAASPRPQAAQSAAATAPTRTDDASLVRDARRRLAERDVEAAFELARQALEREPDNPEIQKLHGECERALFAQLCRDLLTSFRVPRLLIERDELDSLDMSESERYLARRIDGRWDLLSLMRVSSLREAEALITFKRLADRGIIAL